MYFPNRAQRTLGDYSPQTSDVVLAELPPGPGGAAATLRHMRDFVESSIRDPSQTIRNKALDLVSGLPPRQWMAEIRALHAYVKDQIRYVRDPVGLELVQSPDKTIEIGQGDCDDKATLLAALLTATGHPARFIAVGFNGDPLSHVLVQTKVNSTGNDSKDWISLETIIDKPVGWFPPDVTSRYILKV